MKLAGKLSTRVLAKSKCHWEGEYHWVSHVLLVNMWHWIKKKKTAHQKQEEKPLPPALSQKCPTLTNLNIVPAGEREIFTETSLNITKNGKDGWIWSCGAITIN